MSATPQPPIRFQLNESVWLDHPADADHIVSLELEPYVQVNRSDQLVHIEGYLELTGRFDLPQGNEDSLDLESSSLADQLQFQPLEVNQQEIYENQSRGKIEKKFPIDVTVPDTKVRNVEDVYMVVEEFDYDVRDGQCLDILADVALIGVENGLKVDNTSSQPQEADMTRFVQDIREEQSADSQTWSSFQVSASKENQENEENEENEELAHGERESDKALAGNAQEFTSEVVEDDTHSRPVTADEEVTFETREGDEKMKTDRGDDRQPEYEETSRDTTAAHDDGQPADPSDRYMQQPNAEDEHRGLDEETDTDEQTRLQERAALKAEEQEEQSTNRGETSSAAKGDETSVTSAPAVEESKGDAEKAEDDNPSEVSPTSDGAEVSKSQAEQTTDKETQQVEPVQEDESQEKQEDKVVDLFDSVIRTNIQSADSEAESIKESADGDESDEEEEHHADTTGFLTQLMFSGEEAQREEYRKLKMCIVQEQDSLDSISNKYNVPASAIMRANRLEGDQISAGQVLFIPE